MEYLFIYLLQLAERLEGVQTVCIIFMVISFILLAVTTCVALEENYGWTEEDCKEYPAELGALKARKFLAKVFCFCAIAAGLISFLPTEKTLALMGGVYLGKKFAVTAELNSKLDKVNEIVEFQLDKYLKEIKPSND